MRDIKLSVHDLVTANENETTDATFKRLENMVLKAESLGFDRYWFSEHHGITPHLSTSPELLIAHFGSKTKNIRLGTGGTMLMHYSPLKVAENFKTLATLIPNRVDIGFGRAPGGDASSIIALSEGKRVSLDDLYDKMSYIMEYLQDKPVSDRRYARTKALPEKTSSLAKPWILGSSGQSAHAGALMGLGYSFAKFFSVETPAQIFRDYRRNFRASVFFEKPEVMFSYMMVIADSKEEADFLAKPIELMFLSLASPEVIKIKDPKSVKDYKFSSYEESFLKHRYDKKFFIKGTKDEVASILESEIEKYGIDEIMAYSPIFDEDKRHHSYKLLSEIFDKS